MKKFENILSYTFLVYLFLLPWQARIILSEFTYKLPYFSGSSFYITDGLFILLAITWGIWLWLKRKDCSFHNWLVKKKKGVMFFCAVILFSAISLYWTPSFEVGLLYFVRLAQAVVILSMVISLPIKKRLLFITIISTALAQSFFAIYQFGLQMISGSTLLGIAVQHPTVLGASVIEYNGARILRAYGTLPHPNILGGLLSLGLLATSFWYFEIYQSFVNWTKATKKQISIIRLQIISSLSAFMLILVALLFTFSRSAWLGFSLAWLAMFLVIIHYSSKEKGKLVFVAGVKLVAIGVIVLVFLSFIIAPLWTQRLNDNSRLGQISVNTREEIQKQTLEIIGDHKLNGVGIGGYIPAVMNKRPAEDIYTYQPSHNTWLLWIAEFGVVGYIPFLAWFITLLWLLIKYFKNKNFILDQSGVLSASIFFAAGLMMAFDHFWWTLPFGLFLLATVVGLLLKEQNSTCELK